MRTLIRQGPPSEQNGQNSWAARPVEIMRLILAKELTAIDLINFAATEKHAAALVDDVQLWRAHGLRPPVVVPGERGPAAAWTDRFRSVPPPVQNHLVAANPFIDIFSDEVNALEAALAAVEAARVAVDAGNIDGEGSMHEHLARAEEIAQAAGIAAPTFSDEELRAAYQKGMRAALAEAQEAIDRDPDVTKGETPMRVGHLLDVAALYAERADVPFVSLPEAELKTMYRRAMQRCRDMMPLHADDVAQLLLTLRDANKFAEKAGEPPLRLSAEVALVACSTSLHRAMAQSRVHTRGERSPLDAAVLALRRKGYAAGVRIGDKDLIEALGHAMDDALQRAENSVLIRNIARMQVALRQAVFFALAAGKSLPPTAPEWYRLAYVNEAEHLAAAAAEAQPGAKFSVTEALSGRGWLQQAAQCVATAQDPQKSWERHLISATPNVTTA